MKNLFLSTSLAWLLCISGFSQSTAILFDKDVYTMNAKAKTTLDSLLYRIKKSNPQQELCLIGYTDSDADSVYNKKLSLNRAAAVKDYFLTHGVTNKIHIESKGETKLINSDVTPAEKALNRRVDIIQDYTTPNAFFENVKKDVQTFEIDPDKDTIIICKEGTQIHIAARSFNAANYSSPVTFQVQEYLSKSDFVLTNLSTVHTDGRMIESRGMVHLEAFQNNQAVTLKNNKSIGILFKDRNAGDGTSLFTGSMHHNHMVWKENNFTKEKNQGDGHSKITKVETKIYKKKFFFFKSWSGRVKYSQTYWFDSIKGQPYKIVQTYNEGYEKTKKYKIANDSILMKEYRKFLAKQNQINAREKKNN